MIRRIREEHVEDPVVSEPMGERRVVTTHTGGGYGYRGNPAMMVVTAVLVVLVLLLVLGLV